MNNTYAYLGMGLALVGGVALGAGAGYKYAQKQFNSELSEEIRQTHEYYKRVYKHDSFETPEAAAEALNVDPKLVEAATALRSYRGEDLTGPEVDKDTEYVKVENEAPVEKNIFDEGDQLKLDPKDRIPGQPYAITIDEWMENPDEHDQTQLTYYGGDGILTDDEDQPIRNVNGIVGQMNLNLFGASDPDQPYIVLVRNEKLKTDYEIAYSDGKYGHEVAGLQHSDETFQRIRRGRRSADE